MLLFCVVIGFGVTIAAADIDSCPKVSVAHNESNGQCTFTFSVPDVSSRIDDLEKSYRAQLRQQQLELIGLSNRFKRYISEQTKLQKYITEQNTRIHLLFSDNRPTGDNTVAVDNGLEHKTYRDCAEYGLTGGNVSGVYNISLEHAQSPISVWCDMDTANGGRTVIQRRQDGSVDFFNDWETYKKGFGNIDGEYWLGNDNIHHLTNQANYTLRVDMWDFDENYYWAEYENFYIDDEDHKYTLHIGTYTGTAGDLQGLSYHNNRPFSTRDRNNDGHDCSNLRKGAFWYGYCFQVNLNSLYKTSKYTGPDSINWYAINNSYMALKRVEMKIRKVN